MRFKLLFTILAFSAQFLAAGTFSINQRKSEQQWLWRMPSRKPLPLVELSKWPKAELDYFILSNLEKNGLKPNLPAEKRTWLRRVTFCLTGLPPTLAELRQFLENGEETAYDKAVDRLLASPHFGERWARHWMDLVRYAESRGHESDFIIANAWHYRDYLIRAFNTDVTYDQFVREHIAGDLIASPRIQPETQGNESILGTGWVFLGEEVHSPVDIRQDECERIDNKVDVLSKSFLGLTVACARCHDHKFDPISQKDYYALTGMILSSSYRQVRFDSMEHNRKIASKWNHLKNTHRIDFGKAIAVEFKPGVDRFAKMVHAAMEKLGGEEWRAAIESAGKNPNSPLHPFGAKLRTKDLTKLMEHKGLARVFPAKARVILDYSDPEHSSWMSDGWSFHLVQAGQLQATETIPQISVRAAAVRDPFWNGLKTSDTNEVSSGELDATGRSGRMVRTPTFKLGNGRMFYLMRGRSKVYAAVDSHLMLAGPLHKDLIKTLGISMGKNPVWVEHDLREYAGHRVHIEFGPIKDEPLEILAVVETDESPLDSQRDDLLLWQGFSDKQSSLNSLALAIQDSLALILDKFMGNTPLTASQAVLANWMLRNRHLFSTDLNKIKKLNYEYNTKRTKLQKQIRLESRTAVSWFDGTAVNENVLIRGSYQTPGEEAPRRLPIAFAYARQVLGAGSGRLELAEQMLDKRNPLLARVMVNRLWHHLFGRGIVSTVDNFGALGEAPTHPDLLDHLAHQFVHQDNWSVKQFLRRILLSQTYRMDSYPYDSHAEEQDAENKLLHRMPLRRLEAEAFHDAILSVSGRLDRKIGGTPVPVHLTEFVVGRGSPEKSGPADNAGRRSIYTVRRRNFIPTLLLNFDMPIPFSTVGKRNVTNVPGQALTRMNDKFIHEQSRVWARRILRSNHTPSERIASMYEIAFGRPPKRSELAACLETFKSIKNDKYLDLEPMEAWSAMAHAILGLNEFLYIR
jgi:hypothetical protein